MGIPAVQSYRIAKYILEQKLKRNKRYPLVLMLEPLFQCNLACAGCGKIDYPNEILRKRMSVEDALNAVDECGAPVVSIPGGEPLIHKEMPQIVKGIVERKKFVYLCTNALLLEQRIGDYEPSPYLTFSIHLDGNKDRHDESVCREGVFEKAISAIKVARERGFRVTANCTLYAGEDPDDVADFFDYAMTLGIEGMMISPGYSYDHAPRQDVFMGRRKSLARRGRRSHPRRCHPRPHRPQRLPPRAHRRQLAQTSPTRGAGMNTPITMPAATEPSRDGRPLWGTGLPTPDSWRSLRQASSPQLVQRHPGRDHRAAVAALDHT
jgi:hopanoid biosynthesis associated radical SAM protein HpnH